MPERAQRPAPPASKRGSTQVSKDLTQTRHAAGTSLRQLCALANNSFGVQQLVKLQQKASKNQGPETDVMQLAALSTAKLNVVGENHEESEPRRQIEKNLCKEKAGSDDYWNEGDFLDAEGNYADPHELRYDFFVQTALKLPFEKWGACKANEIVSNLQFKGTQVLTDMREALAHLSTANLIEYAGEDSARLDPAESLHWYEIALLAALKKMEQLTEAWLKSDEMQVALEPLSSLLGEEGQPLLVEDEPNMMSKSDKKPSSSEPVSMVKVEHQLQPVIRYRAQIEDWAGVVIDCCSEIANVLNGIAKGSNLENRDVSKERSMKMHAAADSRQGTFGVWKIGQKHVNDLQDMPDKTYNLVTRDEFNKEFE